MKIAANLKKTLEAKSHHIRILQANRLQQKSLERRIQQIHRDRLEENLKI